MRRDLRFIALIRENWESNRLQMSLKRQDFLLSYLKTLSLGRPRFEPATSRMAVRYSPSCFSVKKEDCNSSKRGNATASMRTTEASYQSITITYGHAGV